MSASIGLSAASEKSREFPAFSTGRGNAFCLRHVGDAHHVGDGGYSLCLFGYVTMWVGASQSDARQPIRTSVSETKEVVYRPMRGASWDEEQTTVHSWCDCSCDVISSGIPLICIIYSSRNVGGSRGSPSPERLSPRRRNWVVNMTWKLQSIYRWVLRFTSTDGNEQRGYSSSG